MPEQLDLLQRYPDGPGFKEPTTSLDAAEAAAKRAPTLRARVLCAVREAELSGGLTADECADRLGETEFSVRPRLTELKIAGLVRDSGLRRRNRSGLKAIVWEPAPGPERRATRG